MSWLGYCDRLTTTTSLFTSILLLSGLHHQDPVLAQQSPQLPPLEPLRQRVLPREAAGDEAVLVHPVPVLALDQQPALEHLDHDVLWLELSHVQQHLKRWLAAVAARCLCPSPQLDAFECGARQGEQAVVLREVVRVSAFKIGLIAWGADRPVLHDSFHVSPLSVCGSLCHCGPRWLKSTSCAKKSLACDNVSLAGEGVGR